MSVRVRFIGTQRCQQQNLGGTALGDGRQPLIQGVQRFIFGIQRNDAVREIYHSVKVVGSNEIADLFVSSFFTVTSNTLGLDLPSRLLSEKYNLT